MVGTYSWETRNHGATIVELSLDIADAEDCLDRQEKEEKTNRAIIALYCHGQAYVAKVMPECKDILIDGTRLPYGLDWSL